MSSTLTFLNPTLGDDDTVPPELHEPPLAEREQRPHRLGRFQLMHEIGRGTMGRVYLARDPRDGHEIAIKTLALGSEFDGFALQEARSRFQREAEAAGRLQHPDIVQVLESGEEGAWSYIAMERLRGEDLGQHVQRQQRLSLPQVLRVGARVARALHFAHEQGIIHRDIKPTNVMVDALNDQVKVMDFGIARIADASRTRTGLVLGSPLYMAPEQLAGRAVDGRADLYALGVTLFQLLTGHLPLQGHSMADLIHAVTHTPAPTVRSRRPSIPEAVCNVVSILLEKRPELRYRHGADVAADLELVRTMIEPGTAPAPGRA
ncbi:serine/threonine-protein kinase [Sphaerotilus hippei]|uniref:non-specific serine/threonine protein kinase n=1 Tax=Sphaerotilus hippei TaxID=744406 RepID=A0A318H5X3_9BURK|nr:serine/threonine-protein kinase [Sphaerotilus hippei]PXW99486.1 serine/threonine-protein kinase [Sphaerotilus hippei]